MNRGVRLRLLALGASVGIMGAAIVMIILSFQRQSRELQVRLDTVDAESGEIAAQFKDKLREVTNTRLQYAIGHDPAVEQQFLEASRQLKLWLDGQAAKLTTRAEQEALREAKSAYTEYLRNAEAAPPQSPAGGTPDGSLAAFTQSRTESQHLFDLGEAMASAHYRSRNRLLAEAGEQLKGLRSSLFILLALLFSFGIALAVLAYRDMIAPLQVKLVESQSLVERHEKLASLGLLAAGVAHEIRNPLTAIKAALFILQKRFAPGSPEKADAELVQREISRLERIVSDFLRFARPADPHFTTMPADQVLQEVQVFFAPTLAKSGIRLAMGIPGDCRIVVDSAQIKQVLINLVQNAADSIGRDGTITLRARRERKWFGGEEREVAILEVEDTGKGISPEVGKRLFDPFFTTKDTGSGLGLSIASRIVEKHRGALQYQTQMNHGTTFGIVLPLAVP